eukprot:2982250-Prymnesium_polylepis.1
MTQCDERGKQNFSFFWSESTPAAISSACVLPHGRQLNCGWLPHSWELVVTLSSIGGGIAVVALACVCRLMAKLARASDAKALRHAVGWLVMLSGVWMLALAPVYLAGKPTDTLCLARPMLMIAGNAAVVSSLVLDSAPRLHMLIRRLQAISRLQAVTSRYETVPINPTLDVMSATHIVVGSLGLALLTEAVCICVWATVDPPRSVSHVQRVRILKLQSNPHWAEAQLQTCSHGSW